MAVVTLRISEHVLRQTMLRLDLDAEIIDAAFDQRTASVTLTLDAPGLDDDITAIEPIYQHGDRPDQIRLVGIAHQHTDGDWQYPTLTDLGT